MTSFKSIQQTIAPELDRLNSLISQQLATDNALINQVIETYLKRKGKQIRPLVVILTAKLYGNTTENTITAAAAVELVHNASLIHDDVVDNSPMRRNAPTINAIWDNHIAVLVGDFFISTAMQLAISTGKRDIIDTVCTLGKMLSLGELDQIYNARFHTLTEEAYFRIISRKTASLFVGCAKMGHHSVIDGDDARLKHIMEFAELLGQCFQIRDDIFDYFADPKVGKPTGNDLKEGKITLPLLHTLLDDKLPDNQRMRDISQKEVLDDNDIQTLIRYAVDNGGVDYAYAKMHQLRDKAFETIKVFNPSAPLQALLDLFDNIISRDY